MQNNYLNQGAPVKPMEMPQGMEISPEMMMQPSFCVPFNLNHLPIANITRIMKKSLEPRVSAFILVFKISNPFWVESENQ